MDAVTAQATGRRRASRPDDEVWRTLDALVRWRFVVGAGALGLGLLLRPDVPAPTRLTLLGAGLGALVLATGLFALLHRTKRAPSAQAWVQAIADCALVTLFAAATGGPDSQFVLFYVVVVLWAGVVLETTGGLVTALVASTGYLALTGLASFVGADAFRHGTGMIAPPVPYSPSLIGFLLVMGAAAGSLGGRTRRARQTLALASREVERARLDTDRILESMASGVLTVDTTGTVLHYNRKAEELLGLPLEQVRGRWCEDVFGDGQRPLLERILHTLESGTALAREEVRLSTLDGRAIPLGLSTSFLTDEDGQRRGVIAVFADLSEFKAVEERARRSETLAAIGQLSAGIAHEIRNCLNPIAGSIEYLQREVVLDGENARLMSMVGQECERLNRFVTELLDYAREPQFRMESLPVVELVADALDLVRRHPARRPDHSLVLEDGDAAVHARVDREQFKRVLVNLLQNAIEAMDGPGRVTVRVRPAGRSRVTVEVSDTGPGIAPEHVGRVLEPFFTTKRTGTGLGLAIAARIMERLGGRLAVASLPGQGTTFTLELEREPALAYAA